MLTALLVVIFISIGISAFCSLMEAALFAVPLAHVKSVADGGSKPGEVLLRFKEDLSEPIAAILILNTISHTVGAAVAGAIVSALYGDQALAIFSVIFTLLILYLSEIIPKQIGAVYAKTISLLIVRPLQFFIAVLGPMISLTRGVSSFFEKENAGPSISEQEFLSMTDIGTEEGVLDHLKGSVIRNVIGLDHMFAKDVLTPRVVVFRLPEDTKLEEIEGDILEWTYTRVPLFKESDPDNIVSYVIQRDLFRALIQGDRTKTLSDFARPLTTVPEFIRVDKLLLQLFGSREAIVSVIDEHGGFAGIVTLEDIIEEIVGREILDEYDLVSDLRSYAQVLYRERQKKP